MPQIGFALNVAGFNRQTPTHRKNIVEANDQASFVLSATGAPNHIC